MKINKIKGTLGLAVGLAGRMPTYRLLLKCLGLSSIATLEDSRWWFDWLGPCHSCGDLD